jgi:hypothetical protein
MRTRTSKVGLVLGLLALTAGNALAQKVTTDFDRAVNFAQYKTFKWIKEPKASNPLMRQRIIADVTAALKSKGFQLVTGDGDADLAIAAHAATKEQKTLDTFYSGFGGGWRWGGRFGSATTMVNTYEVNTLIVDIFDAKTKEAIWRGTASKTLSSNPDKNAKNLNQGVEKMFRDFPPSNRES